MCVAKFVWVAGRGGARCVIATILGSLFAVAAHGEPLLTRNQNPLLLPYGLPNPLPARMPAAGTSRLALDVNWSNAADDDVTDTHNYTLDAESVDVRFRFEHAFGDDWAGLIELPWRHLSGGTLDGFIENWHDLFHLPKGPRDHMPKDRLLIQYQQGEQVYLKVDQASSGIADIPFSVGYQLHASDHNAVAGWLTIKAPVGNSNDLLGSGAMDVALSLAGQTQFAERWQLFGQVDAVWLGSGDILPKFQESLAWSGLAGVSWNAWRTLDLTVQVYANSRVFDTSINGLSGEAVVLSYGGTYRTAGGWRIDLGMNEDIQVDQSPDMTFYFLMQKGF